MLAAAKGWVTDHLDIKSAFLYALLPESHRVWMRLPSVPGVSEASGRIVELLKSLYGVRQAPKLWYELLAKSQKKPRFCRSKINDSLFISTHGPPIYLLVYVDDILVVADRAAVDDVKKRLSSLFYMTDLGSYTHFSGINISTR